MSALAHNETIMAAAAELDAAVVSLEDALREAAWHPFAESHGIPAGRIACWECGGRGMVAVDEDGFPVVCGECEGAGAKMLSAIDVDFGVLS